MYRRSMTDSFLKLSSNCSLSLRVRSILMLFLMPPMTSIFHTQLRGPRPCTLMLTPAVLTNVRSEGKCKIIYTVFTFNKILETVWLNFKPYIPFKTIWELADFICSSLTLYRTDCTRIKQVPLRRKIIKL